MRKLQSSLIFAAAVCGFASCTQSAGEGAEPASAGTRSVVATFASAADGVSVYAFNECESGMAYHEVYSEGWDADGRMSVDLAPGGYQFIFAKGFGDRCTLSELSRGTTPFAEAAFALATHDYQTGYHGHADEVWLQDPTEIPAQIYTVNGAQTIPATLTRAVGVVSLSLKRGYYDGEEYQPVPYTDGGIAARTDSIVITVNGVGSTLSIDGGVGSANLYHSFYPAQAQDIDNNGFATFTGPFVIPPGTGGDTDVEISFIPVEGSDIPAFTKNLTARVERNRETQITLWLNSLYPEIGLNISLDEIKDTDAGDEGMWD